MVLFICDGDYYDKNKMQELKKVTTQQNLKVLSSNELQFFFGSILFTNKK